MLSDNNELKYLNEKRLPKHDNVNEINKLSIDEVPLHVAFKHKEWLKIHYIDKELSQSDIAELTNCKRENIKYWLKKYGIKTRDDKESKNTKKFKNKISETSKGREPFSKGLTKYDHPSIMKTSEKMSGENSHRWNGGVCIINGYRKIKNEFHPKRDRDNYILEHREVMEFVLGRMLTDDEVVHHRDRNRLNNIIENLFLFPSNKVHTSFHNYQNFIDPNMTEEKFMEEIYKNEN